MASENSEFHKDVKRTLLPFPEMMIMKTRLIIVILIKSNHLQESEHRDTKTTTLHAGYHKHTALAIIPIVA